MNQVKYPDALVAAQDRVALALGDIRAGGGWDATYTDTDIFRGKKSIFLGVEEKPMRHNKQLTLNVCQFTGFEAIQTKNYTPRQVLYISHDKEHFIIPYDDLRQQIPRDSWTFTLSYNQIINALGIEPLTLGQVYHFLQV